jgi:transcription initiation factor TFIIIB Brf1 subunit/transcription initiation factor TFIIB
LCDHRIFPDPRTGERVCVRCGLVFGPLFSFWPDRGEDGSSFQHLATLERKHDRNFGTEMHPILKSTKIGPETRQWWNRVRRYLGRKSSSERRLVEAFSDIDRVCSYMGLPRGVQDDLCYGARKLAGRMRGSSACGF